MERQLSSPKMTVWIKTKGPMIIEAAPIVRKFVGQYWTDLLAWMRKQGEVHCFILNVGDISCESLTSDPDGCCDG